MEGGDNGFCDRRSAGEFLDPFRHFRCGLVGERDRENRFRHHPDVFDQMGDSVCDYARLPAAGAGQDEHRAIGRFDGLTLLRIELREKRQCEERLQEIAVSILLDVCESPRVQRRTSSRALLSLLPNIIKLFARESSMKYAGAVLASLLFVAGVCAAQDDIPAQDSSQSVAAAAKASRSVVQQHQDKQGDIRRLLQLTGAANLATQSMDGMEKNVKTLISDALPPGQYRERLVELFFEKFHSKRDPNQLIELIVPIYDKFYTEEEVRGLIQFYETPVAKKMLAVLPKVLEESQVAGTKWGEDMGRQCMVEVLQEHPELTKALQEAKANSQAQVKR